MDLDDEINRRYSDMLKRCNIRMEEDDEEQEETEIGIFCDPNIWDSKPEAGPGKGIGFERLRRVTGYISSGDYRARMNNAKQAEVRDRTKHV